MCTSTSECSATHMRITPLTCRSNLVGVTHSSANGNEYHLNDTSSVTLTVRNIVSSVLSLDIDLNTCTMQMCCHDATCNGHVCGRLADAAANSVQPQIVDRCAHSWFVTMCECCSYSRLLFDNTLSAAVWQTGISAIKDEWLGKAKLVFTYTRQHPYAQAQVCHMCVHLYSRSLAQNYQKLMLVAECQPRDETMIKFWTGGLSKQYKSYVLSTCSTLRQT